MTFREWGDGATDRRAHVIIEVSYGDPSWLFCRCGTTLEGNSANELAARWQEHGGSVLVNTGYVERDGPDVADDIEASLSAMKAIVALAESCTCHAADIRDCPNYRDGDEYSDDHDA